jgi:maleylpyruvate isomerase
VSALTDDDIGAPSRLPGWTIGHVLAHVARNADGIRRMAEGAARGEVLDQYAGGVASRAADIDAGAGRTAAAHLDDVRASAAALRAAWDAMPDEAWTNRTRPLGGDSTAEDGQVARLFEVEVHHVDLGRDYTPADWPATTADVGLARVVARLRRHSSAIGSPTVWRLVRTDGGPDITVRRDLTGTAVAAGPLPLDREPTATVRASGGELLAWLLGRGDGGPPGTVDGDAATAAQLPSAYPWQ